MNTKLTLGRGQLGFSLIELMIAMTMTLIVAGASATLLSQSYRMRSREDIRSDAIADAQRALNIVSREIANSGFGLIDNGIVPGDTNGSSIRCVTASRDVTAKPRRDRTPRAAGSRSSPSWPGNLPVNSSKLRRS